MFRIGEVQAFIDTRTEDFLTRRLKEEQQEDWDRICKELAVEVCVICGRLFVWFQLALGAVSGRNRIYCQIRS
jgi:hypothetical protein